MALKYVKKRDGNTVEFDRTKIKNAVLNAASAVDLEKESIGEEITQEVVSYLNIFFEDDGIPEVEQIQDLVEKVLIEKGYAEVAKAYILYREQHNKIRDTKEMFNDAVEAMNDYLELEDWKVKENSNMGYSLQGLNNFISSEVTAQYWLQEIYPEQAGEKHINGDLHIHDLGNLSVYCCGWDLEDFLRTGFRGVPTKIESNPPKHLKTALGQVINFFFTLQGEAAGAMAFSNFDTLLAPFIAYDDLDYKEVKQAMQGFLFNMNVPTRVGFQTPFTNITMDLKVPKHFKDKPVIIGGEMKDRTYGEFQDEMDMFNRAFAEVMMSGDAKGRVFSFPIPTYNITSDFDWENPKLEPIWEMTAKYGIPYFSNFVNSDMDPEDARSMCLYPEETMLIKENNNIKKYTIKEIFKEYKGNQIDNEWFETNNEVKTLSLNPNNGKLEWSNINKFLKTNDNKLVKITAKDGKTMRVSANHLVAVYSENGITTKKAENIEMDDFILVTKDASKILNKQSIISEDLAWFMGLFIADGNYLYDSRYEEEMLKGVQISFNKQETNLINRTKKFIKKHLNYDMKFTLDPRYENSLRGYIYNSEFANKLKNIHDLKKYNKLPNWVWSANIKTITKFIEGFFDGDGYENGKEIHINDEELAEELNLLMQLIGISTTLRYRENSQIIRIQHILGRGSKNDKIIRDKLHNLIPQFLLEQNYVKDENNNNLYQSYGCKMVGLSTVDRWNLSNEKIDSLRNSDYAVTEIKNIEKEDLNYQQEFYDIELNKNHYFVHSDGNITHNCCRLRLDNRELKKRGGGLFGANPMTGSIGVVTLNMPRIGYLSNSKEEYMERVYELMDLAKESLERKRTILENLTEQGLYPYAKFYLRNIKKRFDEYWKNHFNTIGINGMNESLLNFMGKDITDEEAYNFTLEVMKKMKSKMQEYQEETNNLYNLEATPAESTSYRLARIDKQKFGRSIIAANQDRVEENDAEPYYTNSTHLPVGFTEDIFDALELQDDLQSEYTGGCIAKGNKVATDKGLLKIENIVENFEKLKPLKAISYNPDKNQAEWDLIEDAMSIDVSENDKIRIKAEKGLDITTSDWHPFFVVEKHHVEDDRPVCGEEISSFATHMNQCQVLEKRADELESGDYILQNDTNLYPKKKSDLDNDLMWLIGYFISAKKLFENNLKIIDKNVDRINSAAEIINNEFNCDIEFVGEIKSSEKDYKLTLSNQSIKDFLSHYDVIVGDNANKNKVSKKVKEQITQDNIYSFLSGLFEIVSCDDEITEYQTESKELAEDILEICSKAGIVVYKAINTKGDDKNEFEIKFEEKILDQLNNDNNTVDSTQMNKQQFSVVKVLETGKVNVEDNQFYDLTTQKYHNYLAGKNTLVFIHNTVFHGFLGERLNGTEGTKKLVRRIAANFKLPYYTITPTFSICPVHGYLAGEHHYCPKCEAEERAQQSE